MNPRSKIAIAVLALCSLGGLLSPAAAAVRPEEAFRLKPGGRGKICLNCHGDFADKLKRPFIHTPVKAGECSGCHNPHTSDHGKLLSADPARICSVCHGTMIPEKAVSVHEVVATGKCASCHDPHAAGFRSNLLKGGKDLCFGCHKEMGAELGKLKVPHAPVAENCMNCHNPHASAGGPALLSGALPGLCKKCHETTGKAFQAVHMNYPVAQASCTTCHNPHGSNQNAILYDQVHSPVAKRMCNQCHGEAGSTDPLKLKRPGFELCRGCHNEMVNNAFGKAKLHWPIAGPNGCLECHAAHAAKRDNLIRGPMLEVCGRCHADTIRRQERSETKHQPILEGDCSTCHDPHASDRSFLLNKPSIFEVCETCHEWQTHSTHPIGKDFRDPRNPNLTLDCLSCHRSHGTEYPHLIPFSSITGLCVQCHEQFRR